MLISASLINPSKSNGSFTVLLSHQKAQRCGIVEVGELFVELYVLSSLYSHDRLACSIVEREAGRWVQRTRGKCVFLYGNGLVDEMRDD
ncbi:hypothetical protein HPP92_024584 [Vanilla planifolia]|uniref:Uncharacterized protein n=1 Tax=Vanilla planifolia TaxID=51239 RepID=A0A835PR07_VANPL|nr:hypothetical protein HPP92_024584 [Vanilla planifolia]